MEISSKTHTEQELKRTKDKVKGEEEEMMENEASKWKFVNGVNRFVKAYAPDLVRLIVCMLVGWFVATSYFSPDPHLPSSNLLAASQILLHKGVPGSYPPVGGTPRDLLTSWRLGLISGYSVGVDHYRQLQLHFRDNHTLFVTHPSCDGQLVYSWHTFSYNIVIQAQELDTEQPGGECLKEDWQLWEILESISIWSVYEERLYLISERRQGSRALNDLLVLVKK